VENVDYLHAKCAELRKEKEITSFDGITEKDNADLYEALKHKTNHTIYNVKFSKLVLMCILKPLILIRALYLTQGMIILT